MTPHLQCQDLGCRLGGQWVLRGIDLRIAPGERVALVGANGSGKTTLMRVLHGLQPHHQGTLTRGEAEQVMMFQRPHMMRLSVQAQLQLGLWLAPGSARTWSNWQRCRQQAAQVLHDMGWADLAHQPANTLSGGQRQRVAFALAWARQPDVVFLDEPTANLDPQSKRELETRLAEALDAREADRPVTLVFSSHNLGQVKRLATRVIYLERGQVHADLPTERFFEDDLSESHPLAHWFLKGERFT